MTTRPREILPEYMDGQPFRYTAEEFAALKALLGSESLPVPAKVLRLRLEAEADGYLLYRAFERDPRELRWRAELKSRQENEAFVLSAAAEIIARSHDCHMAAIYDMDVFGRLGLVAKDLASLAACYETRARAHRRPGSNVDTIRNNYFKKLFDVWTSVLHRDLRDGYQESVGETSPAVQFVSACARPIMGNYKASTGAVRGVLRKIRKASSAAKK